MGLLVVVGFEKTGGSAQESNLPATLDEPHTGFEDHNMVIYNKSKVAEK